MQATRSRNLIPFVVVLACLAALRVLVGLVALPIASLPAASVIVSIVFVASPILALYRAADWEWTPMRSIVMIVVGVFVQAAFAFIARSMGSPLAFGIYLAISQTGLIVWCGGLGALLATILKDRNVIVPLAIFLALFDIWLVFVPEGFVHQQVVVGPARVLRDLGYQVPAPQKVSQGGHAQALAYVGPADFLFLMMFFVALFKFDMRTRQTLAAIIPTLAAYLLVVLLAGNVEIGPIRLGALPALLPIGVVVLLVNARQFKMNRDEKIATALVLILGIALVSWRMAVQPKQTAPLPQSAPSRPDLVPV